MGDIPFFDGKYYLSFVFLDQIVAESGRRPLAKGERRCSRKTRCGGSKNDELVVERIKLHKCHPLLRAFCDRLQLNTDYSFETCVSYVGQFFAYNQGDGERAFLPTQHLQPNIGRMKLPAMKEVFQAILDVFQLDYVGRLYNEEIRQEFNVSANRRKLFLGGGGLGYILGMRNGRLQLLSRTNWEIMLDIYRNPLPDGVVWEKIQGRPSRIRDTRDISVRNLPGQSIPELTKIRIELTSIDDKLVYPFVGVMCPKQVHPFVALVYHILVVLLFKERERIFANGVEAESGDEVLKRQI
jgi:hypothetical protein